MTIVIRTCSHIFLEQRIDTQPTGILRVEVAGAVVVEPRLLVQFLGVEEVRGVPRAVALLDEDLAVRDVGDVLGDLAVDVGHEGGGAEVIDVVEADISLHFSRHFLGGWHGFAIVSDRGLTRRAWFITFQSIDLWASISSRVLQIYNFICAFVVV
jgi:hypothetical protein